MVIAMRMPATKRFAILRGFTLIELLVVMAIIGTLLSIVVPHYFRSVDRSKESVLRQNLRTAREAIDRFYGDLGRYPDGLEELVARRYLRSAPVDPVTDSAATWVAVAPPEGAGGGKLYDLKSGAPGRAADGTNFAEW
jgi:general secretion pathway protein G